jgi:hypothetical protein
VSYGLFIFFPKQESQVLSVNYNSVSHLFLIPNVWNMVGPYAAVAYLMSTGTHPGVDHMGHLADFCSGIGCASVLPKPCRMRVDGGGIKGHGENVNLVRL